MSQTRSLTWAIAIATLWCGSLVYVQNSVHSSVERASTERLDRMAVELKALQRAQESTQRPPQYEVVADGAARGPAGVEEAVTRAEASDALEQQNLPFERASAKSGPRRKLAGIYTLGTSATSGCFEVTGGTNQAKDLSDASACGSRCPSCFFASSLASDISLTISTCSTAKLSTTASYSGVREYVFINGDDTDTLTVTDGTNSFKLGPMNMVYASCSSAGGNKLYFQSNYGVAGSNVETCPDGCDSATPKKSSDSTTSFTLVPSLTADQKTRVGYLTDGDPSGNVVWTGSGALASGALGAGTDCGAGADYRVCIGR